MMAGIELKRYTPKPETELDAPGLKVIEPVNDRFAAGSDYRDYRLFNKSCRNDNDEAHELHNMVRTIVVQMKDRTSSKKDLMMVSALL